VPPTAIEQGYHAARKLRKKLGLADSQPADPFWAAQQVNLIVARRPFSARNIAGLHLYRAEDDVAVAVINSTDPKARQRFTLAHEIAHDTFDREETIVDDLMDRESLKEIRANCFAGEFLLPQAAIAQWKPKVQWADSPTDIAELAIYYGTSFEATLYRLVSAQCLNVDAVNSLKERRQELSREIRTRISEREEEETILPPEFVALAKEALAKHIISRRKYDELVRGFVEK